MAKGNFVEEVYKKKNTKVSKAAGITGKVLVYSFLGFWGLIVLFPFYWMIVTSIKAVSDYNGEVTPELIPSNPVIDNYISALNDGLLGNAILNTVLFSLVSTAIMVIVIILAAFAFARLQFKGKNLLFTFLLSLMIIPNELVIITNYVTIVNLNLTNTFIGLVMPSIMSIFYIYLLRQSFMQVPDEIYRAAKIDGTSDFKYMWKVLVPIAKPTIISIIILKLIECWNSYVWPRLITTEKDKFLISNAIEYIKSNGFGRENIPAMMAAVVIVSIPIIIVFLVFRKQIMTGVAKSGLKG